MNLFLQQLVIGLSIGSVYALLAVGYALITSIFNFTNFGYGAVMMCGAFAAYFAVVKLGFPTLIGLVFAIIFAVFISLITELVAYRPLRKRKSPRLYLMITAMGFNIFLLNLAVVLLGANVRYLPSTFSTDSIHMGSIVVSALDVYSLFASLISLAVLWVFLYLSKQGLAIRSAAHDTDTAGLMGINVNKVSLIVFAISGITAGIAGTFMGMKYTVYPNLGDIANKAFIASVIGGMGSLPGAVLGGFILGVIETMVSGYISSALRDLFSFGIMILVLIFLPNGIVGKKVQDKL
ncbi:branched-chain amino acid ABC transporter permease [Bacilliculturomica massiliensis]|uniref:branched-chain amino acid ABC transporter permease n=1 Tax=Bacilliculturomica massiliensis TaxID=1917867 RepID=UPI0010313993|nr:branched-chain amino acid ABC transporter permease [Bacilliculturomica massiliensis]